MKMSPELSRGVRRANKRIYDALNNASPEDFKADYLDISHKEGEISYLPSNKKTEKPYEDIKMRRTGKPLRILKRFVPQPVDPWIEFEKFDPTFNNLTKSSFVDTYQRNAILSGFTDRDWENFYYALKPAIQEVPLELVSGEDIRKYYHFSRYSDDNTLTTLRNSCMRHDRNQHQLDLYVESPNIQMLIEFDDNKKVRGRALIWKLTTGETYMDRVYGSELTTQMFRAYAEKQGWYYRTYNTYQNHNAITNANGQRLLHTMLSEIPKPYTNWPFMDTFHTMYQDDKGKFYLANNNVPGMQRVRR